MAARRPRPAENTTTDRLAELPMAFEWRGCPHHPQLVISVLVTRDSAPWCVGGAEVHGHWLDPEQVVSP